MGYHQNRYSPLKQINKTNIKRLVPVWKTPVEWEPEMPHIVCCGVSNKSAAIYNGNIFHTTTVMN
jgi:alcohol dehydrogenase (cytochrome c)